MFKNKLRKVGSWGQRTMCNLLQDGKYFRKPKREKKSFHPLPARAPNIELYIFSLTMVDFAFWNSQRTLWELWNDAESHSNNFEDCSACLPQIWCAMTSSNDIFFPKIKQSNQSNIYCVATTCPLSLHCGILCVP